MRRAISGVLLLLAVCSFFTGCGGDPARPEATGGVTRPEKTLIKSGPPLPPPPLKKG